MPGTSATVDNTLSVKSRASSVARLVAAVMVSVAPIATLASSASAQTSSGSTNGWARFGHYAPTKGPVDLYVDGAKAATDIAFKQITPYVSLSPGPHVFQLRDTGAPSTAPAISVPATIVSGVINTVAGVSTHDGVTAAIFTDNLSSPPSGEARVRLIDTVSDIPSVDLSVTGGPICFSNATFPHATGYQALAAGSYTLDVRASGSTTSLVQLNDWAAQPGMVYSLVVARGSSGMTILPVTDAVGAAAAPAVGPNTGAGGTAPQPRGMPLGLVVVGAVLAGVAGFAVGGGRLLQPRGSRSSDG